MPLQPSTVRLMRQALLLILLIGLVGTEIELLLLKHTDGFWQLLPIGLIGAALLLVAWYSVGGGAASLRALQAMMGLLLGAGLAGVLLHFRGNLGYARDSNPSLSGRALYREAVMGTTPALAPGTLIQLGLLGLVFAFRHPNLRGGKREDDTPIERNPS